MHKPAAPFINVNNMVKHMTERGEIVMIVKSLFTVSIDKIYLKPRRLIKID